MKLSERELEVLSANSLSVQNAKELAMHIESDYTVGGIFPKAQSGDFKLPDLEAFKARWCSWWPVAKVLLTLSKTFSGQKGVQVITQLILLGDQVCH